MIRSLVAIAMFGQCIWPLASVAKEYKFALVPKEESSAFFLQSKYGCEAAAAELEGVSCVYRGPQKTDPRGQDAIIQELIDAGIDGIAIAVIRSDNLAQNSMQRAKEAGVPIISYDADFSADTLEKYPALRSAYVGTDNFELGRALGEQAKLLRPEGGSVVLQTGRPDSPNLNLRLMGVRSALSGKQYDKPPGLRLDGENGWTEAREPFACYGDYERAAEQLVSVLDGARHEANTFIAVGGLPQFIPQNYRRAVSPYKAKLDSKETVLVFADATADQRELLKEGLAHTNVGQNPYEMGRQALFTLHKIATGQAFEKTIHTTLVYCTAANHDSCAP